MKIELKHLAPYLPYGLKVIYDGQTDFMQYLVYPEKENVSFKKAKPILRPLTDLTKEIEVNGEKFCPKEEMLGTAHFEMGYQPYINRSGNKLEIFWYKDGYNSIRWIYEDYQKLFEWHFDVFGLIEHNLAIDINTLES